MKIAHPWRCDYCKRPKEESNHWFMRHSNLNVFQLRHWEEDIAGSELAGRPEYEHICGIECASKALSKWAGTQQ